MNYELGIRKTDCGVQPKGWPSFRLNSSRRVAAFLVTFIILTSFFLIPPALAEDPPKGIQNAPGLITIFGSEAGFEGTPREPEIIVGEILQGGMLLIGVLFGIFIIYGGFLWMIARGNEETVKKSIEILKTSIIGFIIVASAYAISDFVIKTVLSAAYR